MAKFEIWYMRPEVFRIGILGGLVPDPIDLSLTHIHLKDLELPGGTQQLDRVFCEMQGENWSPNGEARDLIRSKGVLHTSMSMGDVIVDEDGNTFIVSMVGFKELFSSMEDL